jgi:hypothetical protein
MGVGLVVLLKCVAGSSKAEEWGSDLVHKGGMVVLWVGLVAGWWLVALDAIFCFT